MSDDRIVVQTPPQVTREFRTKESLTDFILSFNIVAGSFDEFVTQGTNQKVYVLKYNKSQ